MRLQTICLAFAVMACLLAATSAVGRGVVILGYPVDIPDGGHADYGIIDDTPIVQGERVIPHAYPDLGPNASTYFVLPVPGRAGDDAINILILPGASPGYPPAYLPLPAY